MDFSNNQFLEPAESPCTSPVVVDQSLEALVADCEALWVFTSQDTWQESWGRANSLQDWHGVTVTDGRITGMDICGVVGTIPAELGNLINLQHLDLSSEYLCFSHLSGSIPPELGRLTNLTRLDLSWNDLSGPIPAELANLTNLAQLYIGGNRLSGPIPAEIAHLANLWILDLSDNQLAGPIPAELANLELLSELNLSGNRLSGPIPAEIAHLANLWILDLSDNQLAGPIPAELANLELLALSLGGNDLLGPRPDGLLYIPAFVSPDGTGVLRTRLDHCQNN